MKRRIEETRLAWQNFIKGKEDLLNIRTDILDSWKRCKKYKVDYNKGFGELIPKEELDNVLKKNRQLIEVSKPIMMDLYNIVKDSSYAIILCDENGIIIEAIWNKLGAKKRDELNFIKGCKWTEKNVGTNAIGTCLSLDKPIQTLGTEHYCKLQHGWTCSAAPIHNNEGKIIGIIDLSGDFYDFHPHTLGIVVAAANAIQNQLSIIEHRKWIDVSFDSIEDGILILGTNYKIKNFNKKLCEILKIPKKQILNIDIKYLLKDILKDNDIFNINNTIKYSETTLYIGTKRIECSVTISPAIEKGSYFGVVISVKKLDIVRDVVNRVVGNSSSYTFSDIITKNPRLISLIETAKKMAQNDCPVLIQGESGTGKELFAHSIHSSSPRKSGPFVAINCAALPKELVESELFGYEKGSFTGASKEGKPGKFELANKGTIFLDEIGELPLEIQAKLLRILDNYVVTRIGSTYERKLDVRIIAATNRNLYDEVDKKNFRSDLFYRLNVLKLYIPPLRERPEDIIHCSQYFLNKLNENNYKQNKYFDKSFLSNIKKHAWNGNLRELQNVIQRAYYISDSECIDASLLLEHIQEDIDDNKCFISDSKDDLEIKPLKQMEKELITKALKHCNGNVIKASKLINIGKSSMYRKIKEYNIVLSQNGKKI
ncbi:sigma-54-dependent Fis family transcriptional regulator [Tepidibacter aestuarii]|uniref:sigma-54-dependent Fis family transcriptional regulator n=1 Tax=Tepidibacter aestuarii TaxID=2925782 RepID=UPI0020BE5D48|nr:sigma 54-interacting transcriptional regulator [Tepidibacter aestuarii]CAH2214986.1 sigma-54 dependent transcriptional regulator, acetoin dehydrogenase operon transcriptional activator AcoR [Tepidibacter aestuarii]